MLQLRSLSEQEEGGDGEYHDARADAEIHKGGQDYYRIDAFGKYGFVVGVGGHTRNVVPSGIEPFFPVKRDLQVVTFDNGVGIFGKPPGERGERMPEIGGLVFDNHLYRAFSGKSRFRPCWYFTLFYESGIKNVILCRNAAHKVLAKVPVKNVVVGKAG